jgi:hypothetical protein
MMEPHDNNAIILNKTRQYTQHWSIQLVAAKLPTTLVTVADFERWVDYARATFKYLDTMYLDVINHMNTITRENAVVMFGVVDDIIEVVTDYWFTHVGELDNETYLMRGDLPQKWMATRQMCVCLYGIALVTSSILSNIVHTGSNSIAFSSVDVFQFPQVVQQGLAHTFKPIIEYSAMDILWALDTITRRWHSIDYDSCVADYVRAIALRAGMLLRGGAPVAAYEGTPVDNDNDDLHIPYITPSELHTVPSSSGGWCVASPLFRDLLTARLGALVGIHWRSAQYHNITVEQYGHLITPAACRRLVVQTEFDARGLLTPRGQAVPSVLAKFNIEHGGIQIAKLLYRYSVESATADTTRDLYATRLIESLQLPGDVGVFQACNQHRVASLMPTNILKMLYGDRTTREILRRARTLGPEPVLRQAVATHSATTTTTATTSASKRSRATFEEEVAGLCVLDTLFRNRYGINWIDDYLVTPANHQAHISDHTIFASTDPQDIVKVDAFYQYVPRVCVLKNTFDLMYRGRVVRCNSFFDAVALWLVSVLVLYEGKIPRLDEILDAPGAAIANKDANANANPNSQKVLRRDISDLCQVVIGSHTSYVVRASGEERTQLSQISTSNGCIIPIITL